MCPIALAADSHVRTNLLARNFGTLPTVNVGGGSSGLLRFDLGTLPAASTAAKRVKAPLALPQPCDHTRRDQGPDGQQRRV